MSSSDVNNLVFLSFAADGSYPKTGQHIQFFEVKGSHCSAYDYAVFLNVTPSRLYCPKDGGIRFLQNIDTYLPNYIVSHTKRLISSCACYISVGVFFF